MRRLVVLALALLAVPAADAAACERRATGPRFALTQARDGRLVACDHRAGTRRALTSGRRRVYARGLAGATASWVELRGHRPTSGTLVRVRLPGGVPRRRDLGHLDARALENRGRTVRWSDGDTVRYVDVGALPDRDGCPVRDGAVRVARYENVVVTRAAVGPHEVWRVCVQGEHRDPVFATIAAERESIRPLGLDRGTLVVERYLADKDASGRGPVGERYDVRTGAQLRWFPWP